MKLVSAIMPTRGRQQYAFKALQCFMAQTYPRKELVILDDEELPSFAGEVPKGITYVRHNSRNIAEKRNIAAGLSTGDIICHFDSDDWSAPARIANQVGLMHQSGKHVAGYHSMFFYSEDGRAFWYHSDTCYALGTSLMFTREWWLKQPFQQQRTTWGEDNQFVKYAREQEQLHSISAELLMVARAHADNTSPKHIGPESVQYRPVDLAALPAGFPK